MATILKPDIDRNKKLNKKKNSMLVYLNKQFIAQIVTKNV